MRLRICCIALICLIFESVAAAQVGMICNYNGEISSKKILYGEFKLTNDAVSEKTRLIAKKILDLMDLGQANQIFLQRDSTVNNASALIRDDQRLILFRPEFMDFVDTATKSNYTRASILAHEIAHHILGHTMAKNSKDFHRMELAADYWSGIVAYRLGAALGDAQAAIDIFANQNATKTHPAKNERLIAIQNGYRDAKEKYPRSNAEKDLFPTYTNIGFWKPSDYVIKENKVLDLLQFEIYSEESAYIKEQRDNSPFPYYQLDPHFNKESNMFVSENDLRYKPVFNVVLQNNSGKDVIISRIIYRVEKVDSVAGGLNGPINPAAKYRHRLNHIRGDQEFVLSTPFKIEANGIGSFLLELSTNVPRAGLTWEMRVYFMVNADAGAVASNKFGLVMAGPYKY